MAIKILQFIPEEVPTFRPDVAALFGKYLPRHEIYCNLVGSGSTSELIDQGFALVTRGGYFKNRLLREFGYLYLCVRTLFQASKAKFDVIQVRDMVSIGLIALIVARVKGIPFVYWVSYLMCEGRIENARSKISAKPSLFQYAILAKGFVEREIFYRILLRNAHHVFVQSDAMLALLNTQGIPSERMTAVPMGVDMERLRNSHILAQRPPGWEDVPLLAYLGALEKSRNLEYVVDALHQARKIRPDLCLLLIGASADQRDVDNLLRYAKSIGLENAVKVTGWLPVEEAWSLLVGANVAISYIPRGPLYDVSSPTKLLEYLALGVPAIGNDIPDQVHVLLESDAGELASSANDGLAISILNVIGDRPQALLRASRGPAYIEARRSYRVISENLAEKYREIAVA